MPPLGNLLLGKMPPRVLRDLAPRARDHKIGEILLRPNEVPRSVFFPHFGAVVSIIRGTESGSMVEAGVVGYEGLFNVHSAITKAAPTGSECLVQIDGAVSEVGASRLRDHLANNQSVRDLLLAFTSVFLHQVTQNLLCNRLHSIEQRLAKWLLIIRDRTATDELHLTHDFLSHMLGVHRPGVSIAISALAMDGVISHTRGYVRIRDQAGLAARSCECFAAVHDDFETFRATL